MAEYIEKWSVVNRLIDLENEFQQYKPFHGFEHAMYRKICEAEIAIGKTPAAKVAHIVEAPIVGSEMNEWYCAFGKCSNCGEKIPTFSKFCLECGAKTRGD